MPLTLAALLTASTAFPAALPTCSWNRPGHNRYMGDVVAAVDHYRDIPAPVRARLKERMASRSYDEIVSIRRDAIVGKARYRPEIRDMHFGTGQVCGTVNRMQWQADTLERGLVYCEADHCILVTTAGRNVSRITRENPVVAGAAATAPAGAGAGGGGGGGGAGGGLAGLGGGTDAAATDGQEAVASTSFVAGLTGSESAGSAGHWADGTTPAAGNTGPAGAGDSSWLAAAGTPLVGEAVTDAQAVAPPRATDSGDDNGAPFYYSSPGIPGAGRGVTGGTGLAGGGGGGGGIPGGDSTSPLGPPLPISPVPEPGIWPLMLGGLVLLARRIRRRA